MTRSGYSGLMAMVSGWADDPEIDAAFDELCKADAVAFGGVGIANTRGPATKAFYKVRAEGPRYLASIHRLLDQASPAGRVYAATLLTAIDVAAARRAWDRLATQDDTLERFHGCVVDQIPISQYARDELTRMGVSPDPAPAPETRPAESAVTVTGATNTRLAETVHSGAMYPAVNSVAARQAIIAAFHSEPRIVVVTARDERQFVESLFPEVLPPTAVYVCRESRGGGQGPHFDLYQAIVHRDYPFVATLNLAGDATVVSAVLDRTLASYYFKHYPQPTKTAYTARRLVSALTLSQSGRRPPAAVRIGTGVGMIIPQREYALPVVHDVRPDAEDEQGSDGLFLKFIVPRPDDDSLATVESLGFTRWEPGIDWLDADEVRPTPTVPPLD